MRQARQRFSSHLRGLSAVVILTLGLLAGPRVAQADTSAASTGLHFVGAVLQGADRGVRLEGFLAFTPGPGRHVSGTLATFAGTIMGTMEGYTPITVTGRLQQGTIALTFDLRGLHASPMGDETTSKMYRLAIPSFAHPGAHATLRATGQALAAGAFMGTLSGPAPRDTGIWTATPAEQHTFDFNAVARAGKALSLSGQAAVVFGTGGTVEGLFVSDNGNNAYPVHGVVAGTRLSLVLDLGHGLFLYGTGAAGNVDTYQFFAGTFFGPNATTSGRWSAAFTS